MLSLFKCPFLMLNKEEKDLGQCSSFTVLSNFFFCLVNFPPGFFV